MASFDKAVHLVCIVRHTWRLASMRQLPHVFAKECTLQ